MLYKERLKKRPLWAKMSVVPARKKNIGAIATRRLLEGEHRPRTGVVVAISSFQSVMGWGKRVSPQTESQNYGIFMNDLR